MPQSSPSAQGATQSGLLPTNAEDLRIGMYVDLNCSWFRHPFATRSFKITTQKELTVIRALGLTSILVDPALSDREPPVEPQRPQGGPPASAAPPMPSSETNPAPAAHASPPVGGYRDSLRETGALLQRSVDKCTRTLREIAKGSCEAMAEATVMVHDMTKLLSNDAASSAIASFLASQNLKDNSTLHAMNVAALAMMVGRQFALTPEQSNLLGLAGLLHDIGERELPPRLLLKRSAMNKAEQVLYQQHVALSVDLLREYAGFPSEALDLILQHHERVDGSGYPFRLQGDRLSLLARILMVADEYDVLINPPDGRGSLSPADALARLYATGKHSFSDEVLVALVQTLSVYPPGTVVEMNDRSLGLVISMNIQARMRPLVIQYDLSARQDEPIVLDLSQDPARTIVRAVPNSELSQAAYEYLNLQRWIGYFIRSSAETLRGQRAA